MASNNRASEIQQMAKTLGVVIGAASCCEQVTEERVNAVAAKLQQLVSVAAEDPADAAVANEQFSAAVEVGKTAVETGSIDPEHAEAALSELEQQLYV
jgi:hypothetical protein